MGPQWDALGLSSEDPILVEAKAHIGEFRSPPSGANSLVSKDKIKSAFVAVCNDLMVTNGSDWTKVYYQYANRISHLWWLRKQRREQPLDAKLLFINFIDAKKVTQVGVDKITPLLNLEEVGVSDPGIFTWLLVDFGESTKKQIFVNIFGLF
mgnify:CR=1 FL=1